MWRIPKGGSEIFDDGPHPYYTEQLLDGLKERGAKASFFVMGKQAEAYPKNKLIPLLLQNIHNIKGCRHT